MNKHKMTGVIALSKNDVLVKTVQRLEWQQEWLAKQIQYCAKNSPSPNCMECTQCWIKQSYRAWEATQCKN